MKRYESYKDSGVKWLGEIPGHWEGRKIKYTFKERSQKGFPKLSLLSATQQYGVIKKDDYENRTVVATKGLDTLKLVCKNDFVISLRSFEGGIEMSHEEGIISPAYTILIPKKIEPSYFRHLGKSPVFINLLKMMVTGIREGQNIDYSKLRTNLIPIPPKSEQTAIANYLDSVTSKIDKAISQQQKMIDLLNERKQIIIQNAVTKGLDPNAKMKDSGVEWIGEIPENWEVRRLNSIGRFSKGGNISRDQLTEDGKCEAILYGDIYTKYYIKASIIRNHITEKTAMNSVRIKSGDILMTGSGETKEDIGKTIMFDSQIAYIGGDVILFRQNKMDSLFLSYALNSMYAKVYRYKESKGEIVVHIYSNALKSMKIAAPPMNEQSSIVKYLNQHFLQIDESITSCNKMISLLQERKQIIINDVVTGKVKVI